MCHALKTVAKGRDADNLSSSSKDQIEDLGRCVDPAQPTLALTITADVRIMRNIESAVSERANCARDLRGYHLGPTEECLIVWKMEMWETLRAFDVRRVQLTIPTISKPPQENLGRGGALEINEIKQHVNGSFGAEPPAPASDTVHFCVSTPAATC